MILIIYMIRSLANIFIMIPWLTCGILIGILNKETGSTVIFSWIRFFLQFSGIKIRVENENSPSQNLSGCVFTLLAQTSLLDAPVWVNTIPRPCRGIVNLEYALIPFFGWSMWVCCYILVRQWPWQSKNTLAKVDKFLKGGGNLCVSIEGKRSKDGTLSIYKKGPVVVAIRSQAKIVPVIIDGTKECLGHGQWHIRKGVVSVRLLHAIPTDGLTYDDRDALVEHLASLARREFNGN